MNNVFRIILIISLFLVAHPISWAGEDSLQQELVIAKARWQECLRTLPSRVRWGLTNKSLRGRRQWSPSVRKKVDVCLERRRDVADVEDIIDFSLVLIGLHDGDAGVDRETVRGEAEEITRTLVKETRVLNREYKMAGSALWHNFLIKLGMKEKGYCYHWTTALLKVLPKKRYRYFERHWGATSMDSLLENNAVIITRRDEPAIEGVVYDAWRGKGEPFWRYAKGDKYEWEQRFSEYHILYGQAVVVGK